MFHFVVPLSLGQPRVHFVIPLSLGQPRVHFVIPLSLGQPRVHFVIPLSIGQLGVTLSSLCHLVNLGFTLSSLYGDFVTCPLSLDLVIPLLIAWPYLTYGHFGTVGWYCLELGQPWFFVYGDFVNLMFTLSLDSVNLGCLRRDQPSKHESTFKQPSLMWSTITYVLHLQT